MLKLIMTGEAAILAGCDRRTFKAHAKKMNIKPSAMAGDKELYKSEDVEKVVRSIKAKRGS